jgi:hypothetical protein
LYPVAAVNPVAEDSEEKAHAIRGRGCLRPLLLRRCRGAAGRTTQTVGPGPYGGFAATRHRDFLELPYLKLCERRGAVDAPWFETWIRDNLATSEYWRGIAYQTPQSYARVKVPSLKVTGWFDDGGNAQQGRSPGDHAEPSLV